MTRRGYTFIEVLLVLALLAVLAGIAWPSVLRFSNEQAMKDAAEFVRAELDRTRFRAIDAGLVYQFRYEPNGRHFVAVPAERDTAPLQVGSIGQTQPTLPVISGRISDGLTFRPLPGSPSVGQLLSADWLAGVPDGSSLQQIQWSSPIFFRPDGTGTTAAFRITDTNQRYVELSVRELTGMTTAGPLREETTPWD